MRLCNHITCRFSLNIILSHFSLSSSLTLPLSLSLSLSLSSSIYLSIYLSVCLSVSLCSCICLCHLEPSVEVAEYLKAAGVNKVIVGHQPRGDAPLVIDLGTGVQVIYLSIYTALPSPFYALLVFILSSFLFSFLCSLLSLVSLLSSIILQYSPCSYSTHPP